MKLILFVLRGDSNSTVNYDFEKNIWVNIKKNYDGSIITSNVFVR